MIAEQIIPGAARRNGATAPSLHGTRECHEAVAVAVIDVETQGLRLASTVIVPAGCHGIRRSKFPLDP